MTVQIIDKGWERIKRSLKLRNNSYVKVGFPGEKAEKHEDSDLDVAAVAAIQEYGTSRIPSRPFMAQSFDKKRSEIEQLVDRLDDAIFEGRESTPRALTKLGIFHQGQVRQEIVSGDFKPLAASTIAARAAKVANAIQRKGGATTTDAKRKKSGGNTPLIDSGQMMGSVDFEVFVR